MSAIVPNIMKKHIPYYDPTKSYEDNYKNGPFGIFRENVPMPSLSKEYTFFDSPVNTPFGIPAGPLLNGAFMISAWRCGFSINTYKTVRSRSFPCHQFPNIIAVHGKNRDIHPGDVVIGDTNISGVDITSDGITNSFGVPSQSPDIWINDIQETLLMVPRGSVLIASFMGTREEHMTKEQYVQDFSKTCTYVKQTGARILEVNFSCPNIGKEGLICNDTETSKNILEELHAVKGNNPLLVKIGYFSKEQQPDLETLLDYIHTFADGVVAINTIPATVIDENGHQVLPGSPVRRSSGTCGAAIRWGGLEMAERIMTYKQKRDWRKFVVVGVGGVITADDYFLYKKIGVDAVQSGVGSMWNPYLAQEIAQRIKEGGTT